MILCDTGPLVAAFNAADRDHVRCTAFLRENWSRLVVPYLAVTEVCHLLADRQRRGRPPRRAGFSSALARGASPGGCGHHGRVFARACAVSTQPLSPLARRLRMPWRAR